MDYAFLAGGLGELTNAAKDKALETGPLLGAGGQAFATLAGNWWVLLLGIALIAATVVLVGYLKNILANSIIGLVAWSVLQFLFGVKLPLMASLVVSAIFGLAGIGVMLVLKFLGINF